MISVVGRSDVQWPERCEAGRHIVRQGGADFCLRSAGIRAPLQHHSDPHEEDHSAKAPNRRVSYCATLVESMTRSRAINESVSSRTWTDGLIAVY